ncbi:hypothetical protein MUDAN_DOGOELCO_02551 [Lactiplantibacillus mudanjiangensis]|uniref:hypothetical protein n=1 Tax=Lactiplantibacillus mudanjiangensis TaxID=1296538 RepID=UPI001013EEC6|nr:hypothetical protein [Lactiplantibacillus mudanjiangensis]VDG33360.1 hypothetical protein MUDAN_DOGOELCO_02551 [Lactiplantibacillus mudanjiangensis]
MKVKLRDNTGQEKYDLYQVGNVIVTDANGARLVVSMTTEFECEKEYHLINLRDGEDIGICYKTLDDLANCCWQPTDRLMVNPTLVEEGAE